MNILSNDRLHNLCTNYFWSRAASLIQTKQCVTSNFLPNSTLVLVAPLVPVCQPAENWCIPLQESCSSWCSHSALTASTEVELGSQPPQTGRTSILGNIAHMEIWAQNTNQTSTPPSFYLCDHSTYQTKWNNSGYKIANNLQFWL